MTDQPFTRGERTVGMVGLVVCVVLLFVCLDMATGGRLSGLQHSRESDDDGD